MRKYRSARAVLAGMAVIALAGCGASASTSGAASGSTASGSAVSGSTASGSTGAGGSPSARVSTGATPGATSNSFVSAGSVPFPIAVGNTWVYQTRSSINNTQSLVTNRVVSVTPVPGGHRVTMSSTIGPAGPGKTTQETYIFYANGQIGYPVNEANGVSVLDSGGVRWPDAADLASGRDFRSVLHVRVSNALPARYQTANVTVRGGGTASVTVLAGTYQATIVDMILATKVGSFGTSVLVKTWTAPGTGPVKWEVSVLAAGKTQLITTEELLSFTRG
jgi:hypothetical protein